MERKLGYGEALQQLREWDRWDARRRRVKAAQMRRYRAGLSEARREQERAKTRERMRSLRAREALAPAPDSLSIEDYAADVAAARQMDVDEVLAAMRLESSPPAH